MASKMNRADKLRSMAMPKKPMGAKEAEIDLESLMQAEPETEAPAGEMSEESGYIGPEMEAAPAGLEQMSDKELLDELKKRGLMSKHSPLGKAAESDMVASEMEPEIEEMKAEEAEEMPEDEALESAKMQELEKRLGVEKHPELAKKAMKAKRNK